jgi:glycosyltransferase involved in cell wall biosynthesis
MKILIYNWRDIKNPKAGGAEVLTHELAKGWVDSGHEVTYFSSSFKGAKKREKIDGIDIIRAGNAISVYWQGYIYYKKEFKGKFDLIIDEINTIPFFTCLYARQKIVVHINQLAKEVWFYESIFPVSLIGYLLEPLFLKLYKKDDVITISQSTKTDLIDLGFKEDKINIIPMGIEFEPLKEIPNKEAEPTLIYVGRLKKSKRVHHIIKAYKEAKQQISGLRLWIVGNGDRSYKDYLYNLAQDEGAIEFFHNLDNQDKLRRMSLAHLIVVTSAREGWGLIVTEANAMGTPALTYDVPGLRDSNKNKKTGIVPLENNPRCLSHEMVRFFKDKVLMEKLSKAALEDSRKYSWDRTVKESLEVVEDIGPSKKER